MVNNYSKMRRSNSKAKEWLIKNKYSNIHFFPHSRFMKGYVLFNEEFDGICYDEIKEKMVLFQVKSNKNISKKIAINYLQIAKKCNIVCLWLNNIDHKGIKDFIFD